ncbi:MAG: Wzz/FepE/Etk N-terminal domain-containing protein, partial [Hyphomonas sp.]|nr:Wzz/FepE/Etk N-terminal domain-containing protein [Hyphomonas sp.]
MTKTFSFELPSQVPAEAETEDNNMPTDLKSLLGAVYRRFWLIALSFLTVFTLVAYSTFNQTPLYQASSVVQLDTEQQNVIDLGSVLSGLAVSTAVIDTEVMIMKSKSLLTKVAVKQKLTEDPEFNWTLRERKIGTMGKLKNGVKSLLGMDTTPYDPFEGMSVDERESAILESVVDSLMGRVGVSRVGTTYLINVQVTSTSPETAARLANAIADQYRVQQLETKLDATRRATEWLSDRVFALREEVEEKENRVAKFIA